MRSTREYKVEELKNINEVQRESKEFGWIPARPQPPIRVFILGNIVTAFKVLIGKYDAIDWRD